jgi:hypothetical protein
MGSSSPRQPSVLVGCSLAETLVKLVAGNGCWPSYCSGSGAFGCWGWGVDRVGGAAGGWCSDILLGPEETSVPLLRWGLFVFSVQSALSIKLPLVCCGGVWWGLVRGWLLFENCTVDASIFVVKFTRADGECLGTRSR